MRKLRKYGTIYYNEEEVAAMIMERENIRLKHFQREKKEILATLLMAEKIITKVYYVNGIKDHLEELNHIKITLKMYGVTS